MTSGLCSDLINDAARWAFFHGPNKDRTRSLRTSSSDSHAVWCRRPFARIGGCTRDDEGGGETSKVEKIVGFPKVANYGTYVAKCGFLPALPVALSTVHAWTPTFSVEKRLENHKNVNFCWLICGANFLPHNSSGGKRKTQGKLTFSTIFLTSFACVYASPFFHPVPCGKVFRNSRVTATM